MSEWIKGADGSLSRPGYDALWGYFGLTYASWLVLPRAFMHEMPDDWQARMAQLMIEWREHWDWPDDLGTAIVCRRLDSGHFAKWPEYLYNYRHPNLRVIASLTASSSADSLPAKESPR